jgi:group I intron endonuclease
MKTEEMTNKLKEIGYIFKNINEYEPVVINNKMRIKWDSKISGIYIWLNKINNKLYIGRTNNVYKRVYDEKNGFANNKHGNLKKLYNAVKKYGINNFEVYLVLRKEKEKLPEIEHLLIDYYNSIKNGYNCCYGGIGTAGHVVSEEQINRQKERMSNYWTKERKREHSIKMRNWFYDKPIEEQNRIRECGMMWMNNEETIKKQKENYRKTLTQERANNQSKRILEYYKNNRNPRIKTIDLINPEGNIIKVVGFDKFCINNHLDYATFSKLVKKQIPEYRGYKLL